MAPVPRALVLRTHRLAPLVLQRPLKAQLTAEVAAAANEAEAEGIRMEFDRKERALEHSIDHSPMELHLDLDVAYKCATQTLDAQTMHLTRVCLALLQLPVQVGHLAGYQHKQQKTFRSLARSRVVFRFYINACHSLTTL